jgi:hypothetical protein
MPKSMTLTWPFCVIITLPGLMSRWMIPCRWLNSRAAQMSAMISSARRGWSRCSWARTSLRVRPLTNSMTMNGSFSPVDEISSPVS